MAKSVLVIAVLAASLSTAAFAAPISEAVKQACSLDYGLFCGEYGVGSNPLRDCMDRNGESLSKQCINALIKAGEVSQGEVTRRANKLGN